MLVSGCCAISCLRNSSLYQSFFKLPSSSVPSTSCRDSDSHGASAVNCLHFRLETTEHLSKSAQACRQCLPPADTDKHLEIYNNTGAQALFHFKRFKISHVTTWKIFILKKFLSDLDAVGPGYNMNPWHWNSYL